MSAIWRALNGAPDRLRDFRRTRWIFLRALGLIHFVAFLSFATQLRGLIGANGILPAAQYLDMAHRMLGAAAYWKLPTLAWLVSSDTALLAMCIAGMLAACLVVAGTLVPVALALCWVLFLSLVHAGQDFLSFQWDILLLETTFLAIFFAPMQVIPRLARERPVSPTLLWLLRFLLFRLMFSSGVVKLPDPTWTKLEALNFHYETQPLPTALGWWAHQLPPSIQSLSVVILFIIELGVPFLIFAPRRLRFLAAGGFVFLMLLIGLTGNYTYFNFLTVALCILLLDDAALKAFVPARWTEGWRAPEAVAGPRWQRARDATLAVFIGTLGAIQLLSLFAGRGGMPASLNRIVAEVQPFFLVNHYGLFAFMTRERNEIEIEGSENGVDWKPYVFRYKPGDVNAAPRWIEPFQPRLDWQMWFAALGTADRYPWFGRLLESLLRGTPEVVALFEHNPYPDKPPRHVRALFYQYRFTNREERAATGAWWKRELKGLYFRPAQLR